MMVNQRERISVDDFVRFLALAENADRRVELIDGEIVEMPGNWLPSKLALVIAAALLSFIRSRKLGEVTGADAGFIINGHVIAPDVAFVAADKAGALPAEGFTPFPPDLAIEVVSPSDKQPAIRRKLALYAEAGVTVWMVYPARQVVELWSADQPVEIVGAGGVIDGGALLPGFTLPVDDIFTQP